MSTKAIIWDMDGVISNTQHLHATIESELLARFGILLSPEEITRKYAGTKTIDFFKEILAKKGIGTSTANDLVAEKWKRMVERVASVSPIQGTPELIKEAHKRNVPQAIASSSEKEYVVAVITHLKLKNYFTSIMTGDQVSKGKPDPEIFLKAAASLKVIPSMCVVIEDGISGMVGANRAGMKCIAFSEESLECPVTLQVNDLRKLTLDTILSL